MEFQLCKLGHCEINENCLFVSESWKAPRLPNTLTETLASLSLNPKVETLVDSTITKNHEITVDEIRTILKDKLRCLNSLSKVNV